MGGTRLLRRPLRHPPRLSWLSGDQTGKLSSGGETSFSRTQRFALNIAFRAVHLWLASCERRGLTPRQYRSVPKSPAPLAGTRADVRYRCDVRLERPSRRWGGRVAHVGIHPAPRP